MNNMEEVGTNVRVQYDSSGHRLNREDRKNYAMIVQMNKKLHTLQPYFDLITNHIREIMMNARGDRDQRNRSRGQSNLSPRSNRRSTIASFYSSNKNMSFDDKLKEVLPPSPKKQAHAVLDFENIQKANRAETQEDALAKIKITDKNLPENVVNNKMRADRLLFKEA